MTAENDASTDSDGGSDAGAACFRNKTQGFYKTFRPGDFMLKTEWVKIHNGPCQCEGKFADECQEPGDEN
jgi:hypothetical protein